MKLMVDTMSVGDREAVRIWQLLGLFIGLIALESVLWRIAGLLGCKTLVATDVDVRLDLFKVGVQRRHLENGSADADDGVHQRTRWTPWKTRVGARGGITPRS